MVRNSAAGALRRGVAAATASVLGVGILAGTVALGPGLLAPTAAGAASNTYTQSVGANACGGWKSLNVPGGTISTTVTAVGGGAGGSSNTNGGTGNVGGGGGSITTTLSASQLAAGRVLWIYTGCGGGGGQNSGSNAAGGSGEGTDGANNLRAGGGAAGGSGGGYSNAGGGGGGATLVCVGTTTANCGGGTILAVAGGGGGAGGAAAAFASATGGAGGSGGQNGAPGGLSAACTSSCAGGGGGTQSAAGTAGTGGNGGASPGSASTGGAGASYSGDYEDTGGGGGGGGYWGGGGGTSDYYIFLAGSAGGTGGGGGSSYFNPSYGSATFSSVGTTGANCGAVLTQCASAAGGQGGAVSDSGAAGSVSVTSVVGAATIHSSFSAQPTTGLVGQALSPQPQVTALDYLANPVSGDPIQLSIASQPGGATLSCAANPVSTSASGVAAFSGCSISGPVGNYTLRATDTTDATVVATTGTITLSPGPLAGLSFTSAPVSGTTGAAPANRTLGPITVKGVDGFGNPVTSGATVTLSSTSAGGSFAASSGGAAVTSVTLATSGPTAGTATVYYGDTSAGTPTLTAQSGAVSGTQKATLTNRVSVTSPGNQSSVSGSALSGFTVAAGDSSPTATLSWAATGLPAGVSIAPTTGAVSGIPTTACSCNVAVTVTDSAGFSGSASFNWSVTNLVTVTNPGSQRNASGALIPAVAVAATTSSSTASVTTYAATGLPRGLFISSSTGVIQGLPTLGGTSSVTVTATDSAGFQGSTTFSWTITNTVTVGNPGTVSTVSGTAAAPLTLTAADTESTPTFTWSATGLPVGVSLNSSTGTISGTPTTACACTVVATATDEAGFAGQATFTYLVTNRVTVTNPGNQVAPSGQAASPVGASATDSSPVATISHWSTTGLPPGLTVSPSTGTISGTPTKGGTFSVTLTATDSAGYSGQTSFIWTVTNTVTVTSPGPQSSTSGQTAQLTLTAGDTESTPTFTWTASGLPAGLSINPTTGVVSGTPTTACACTVVATATDEAGYSGPVVFSWSVGNSVSVTPVGTQTSDAAAAVSPLTLSATDSSSTATVTSWTDGGTLPPGLSVSNAGTVTGTPAAPGTYAVTLTATDSAGYTGSTSFTWTVVQPPTVTSAATTTFAQGRAGTFTVTAAGSPTPALAESGALPPGVTFTDNGNGTATLAGTPTAQGTFPLTITASNGALPNGVQSFTLSVASVPLFTSPATGWLTIGKASTFTITAVGPPTVTSMTKVSGTLPTGLTFTDQGGGTATISGTATGAGRTLAPITVRATNALGSTSQVITLSLGVVPTFKTAASRTFAAGSTSTFTVTTGGSPAPALTESGALPPGVTFTDNGDGTATLAGTPPAGYGGAYPLTLTAANAVGSATQAFTLTVSAPPTFTSAASTTFTTGKANTFTVTVLVGYPGPATIIQAGTLPPGITFKNNGNGTATLQGTPPTGTNKTYALTFQAQNGTGTVSQKFSLVVAPPAG
jgi:hypothetical protein